MTSVWLVSETACPVLLNDAPMTTAPDTPADYGAYADWKAWGADGFMQPGAAERGYYTAELRGHPVAGKPVLELGFGNGGFLGWAKDAGAVLHGTELQPELARRAAAAGVTVVDPDIATLLPALDGHFALVAAFDVFEHIALADLPAMLGTISGLLADGGLLIARYPNGQSPFGRIHQYGDITHRAILSADIMAQLIADLPFDAVHLGDPARAPGAVQAMRGIAQTITETALRRLYGTAAPMKPNSIAILKRRPRGTTA
jgi:hypothetical protein